MLEFEFLCVQGKARLQSNQFTLVPSRGMLRNSYYFSITMEMSGNAKYLWKMPTPWWLFQIAVESSISLMTSDDNHYHGQIPIWSPALAFLLGILNFAAVLPFFACLLALLSIIITIVASYLNPYLQPHNKTTPGLALTDRDHHYHLWAKCNRDFIQCSFLCGFDKLGLLFKYPGQPGNNLPEGNIWRSPRECKNK